MAPDPGEPAKSRPGLLGRIRIDQRLNEQVPLDIPFTDETGREIRLRRAVRQAARDPGARVLRVSDAVHAGPERTRLGAGRHELRAGTGVRRRCRELQSQGRAGAGRAEKGELSRAVWPAAHGSRLAFPHRQGRVDQAADRRHRLPLRVRPRDPAVRAWRRHRGADAEGRHLEVLLRNRILGARYQAGADRSLRRSHRHADRRRAAVLLPLRPGDRKVRRRRAADGARRRRGIPPRAPIVPDREPATRSRSLRPFDGAQGRPERLEGRTKPSRDPSRASGSPEPSRRAPASPGS